MNEVTLKRGRGLVFHGENWKLAGEGKWLEHRMYVPNGREPLVGVRILRGKEHSVFRCLDDDFFAQPTEICGLPDPEDPMEALSV